MSSSTTITARRCGGWGSRWSRWGVGNYELRTGAEAAEGQLRESNFGASPILVHRRACRCHATPGPRPAPVARRCLGRGRVGPGSVPVRGTGHQLPVRAPPRHPVGSWRLLRASIAPSPPAPGGRSGSWRRIRTSTARSVATGSVSGQLARRAPGLHGLRIVGARRPLRRAPVAPNSEKTPDLRPSTFDLRPPTPDPRPSTFDSSTFDLRSSKLTPANPPSPAPPPPAARWSG
jgi:hypothetical protein